MVKLGQQTLPLRSPHDSDPRRVPAGLAHLRTSHHVRWGAAVAAAGGSRSADVTSAHSTTWRMASSRRRRGGRTTVWVDEGFPERLRRAAPKAVREVPGRTGRHLGDGEFTRNRIRHAFELFGACMMIVTFLVLAVFA